MAQQSANYLFKLSKKVFTKGKKAEGVFFYLNEMHLLKSKCGASSHTYFLDIDNVEQALKVNLLMKLNSIMKKRA